MIIDHAAAGHHESPRSPSQFLKICGHECLHFDCTINNQASVLSDVIFPEHETLNNPRWYVPPLLPVTNGANDYHDADMIAVALFLASQVIVHLLTSLLQ
jgi:hypothetical protein